MSTRVRYGGLDIAAMMQKALDFSRRMLRALVDGKVVAQPKLAATLAADHRVVDGAVGAAWLAALRALVENPAKLLL